MKNLKGAVPPERDEPGSSSGYFTSLGIGLIIIGIIMSLGSIILFFTALSSGTTYDEGRIYMSPAVFAFLMVMALVFLTLGMALMAVAKRIKKKAENTPSSGEKAPDGADEEDRDSEEQEQDGEENGRDDPRKKQGGTRDGNDDADGELTDDD